MRLRSPRRGCVFSSRSLMRKSGAWKSGLLACQLGFTLVCGEQHSGIVALLICLLLAHQTVALSVLRIVHYKIPLALVRGLL